MDGLTTLAAVRKRRDPNNDKLYEGYTVERRKQKQCSLVGCNNHLTFYKGPGSTKLCREHQLTLREYGGPGRMDRPWTFWKKDTCEACGHDPKTNPQIAIIDEPLRSTVARMMLHVDHQVPAGKDRWGWETEYNHPTNLKTLCMECHALKTYKDGDHWND